MQVHRLRQLGRFGLLGRRLGPIGRRRAVSKLDLGNDLVAPLRRAGRRSPALRVGRVRPSPRRWSAWRPGIVDGDGRRHRVIRFLGSGEVCSDYSEPVGRAGAGEGGRRRVGPSACFARASPGNTGDADPMQWDMIELTGVDSRDVLVDWLAGHLALGGCTVHRRMGPPCRRTELPEKPGRVPARACPGTAAGRSAGCSGICWIRLEPS